MDGLARYREHLLERAEALDWPELIVEDLGRVAGASGWLAAVELATADELIVLSRTLAEPAA